MTNPTEIQRRVSQLGNDVQSIYEMLTTIGATQMRHTNRLDAIEARADGIDVKVDGIQVKVDAMEAKVNGIDAKVNGIDAKVNGIEATQKRHSERLNGIESTVESLDTKMDSVLDILRDRGSAAR